MPKEWGYRGKQRTCKKCRGDDVEDRGGAVDVGQEKGEEEERKDENKRSEAFDNSGSADANDSGARKLQDKEEEMEKSSVNGKTEKKKKDDNNDEVGEAIDECNHIILSLHFHDCTLTIHTSSLCFAYTTTA